MKSPFPGMDPYLEARWGDVHTRMAFLTSVQLGPQMPKGLRTRIQEDFVIESSEARGRRIIPDAAVVERPNLDSNREGGPGGLAVVEPVVVTWEVEPRVQRSVHIVDTERGHRLVTAIEFISPTNKTKRAGRRAYLRKQRDILAAGASLIEIDLIRAGRYLLYAPESAVPSDLLAPYRVCVSRGWDTGRAEMYRIRMPERLPKIRVPLRPSDADVLLDLQQLIDDSYATGSHDDIDYTVDPDPPLAAEDAAWADGLLRQEGKR
jgi:Protein of unknown function (DUF4058)